MGIGGTGAAVTPKLGLLKPAVGVYSHSSGLEPTIPDEPPSNFRRKKKLVLIHVTVLNSHYCPINVACLSVGILSSLQQRQKHKDLKQFFFQILDPED